MTKMMKVSINNLRSFLKQFETPEKLHELYEEGSISESTYKGELLKLKLKEENYGTKNRK